jgi:hypothetical protein
MIKKANQRIDLLQSKQRDQKVQWYVYKDFDRHFEENNLKILV